MTIREERREATIERMADHLLSEGMTGARLRPLAVAAGTSDRMLLYYFADKHELVTATLERVAARLTHILDQAIPKTTQLSFADLLAAIWHTVGSAALRPYMRLWLELAAVSGRGQNPHREVARAIMDGFTGWTSDHLIAHDETRRAELTALLLTTIEGALFLDAIGRDDMANVAIAFAAKEFT